MKLTLRLAQILNLLNKEREELEAKLNDKSVWPVDSEYFESIQSQLYSNFEEEWDINHSIAEINQLQIENKKSIRRLAKEAEVLIKK